MIYNYSCQAGDYYRSYYRTTLEFYHNMTTTPSRSLPTLRAPKVQALKDWRDVKDYLVDNLVKSRLYNFDYKEASRTAGVYYSTFNELRLPPATTDDESESEEELQSMIQTHYLWLPYHYTHNLETTTRQEPTTLWWRTVSLRSGRLQAATTCSCLHGRLLHQRFLNICISSTTHYKLSTTYFRWFTTRCLLQLCLSTKDYISWL